LLEVGHHSAADDDVCTGVFSSLDGCSIALLLGPRAEGFGCAAILKEMGKLDFASLGQVVALLCHPSQHRCIVVERFIHRRRS